jgi:hypothetical protein
VQLRVGPSLENQGKIWTNSRDGGQVIFRPAPKIAGPCNPCSMEAWLYPIEIAPCKRGATEAALLIRATGAEHSAPCRSSWRPRADRGNKPCRYQIGCKEIGTGDRNRPVCFGAGGGLPWSGGDATYNTQHHRPLPTNGRGSPTRSSGLTGRVTERLKPGLAARCPRINSTSVRA